MAGNEFSVVAFNLHGFNQGSQYLHDLLECNDIVCVQEHWLSSTDADMLNNINNNFTVVASFAVDAILGKGVLRGRPFGGLAIFVRANIINNLKIVNLSDRLIVIKVNNVLLSNVYMPCNDSDLAISILGTIADLLDNNVSNADHVILAGDFNLSLIHDNPMVDSFKQFLNSCHLVNAYDYLNNRVDYTYKHPSLDNKSVIDYIFVSNFLFNALLNVNVQDSGVNFSDHVPVIANFKMCIQKNRIASTCKTNPERRERNIIKTLRWDKADLGKYYEYTYRHLCPIYNELLYISDLNDLVNYFDVINDVYRKIIAALISSDVVIPRVSCNVFKHWWNHSLDEFKQRSIECYSLWVTAGKPREGEIYRRMAKAKSDYKEEIIKFRTASEQGFSEEMSDTLLSKDADGFWKTWNRKFTSKSVHASSVDGYNSSKDIANAFKNFFSRYSMPNNDTIHRDHKKEFWEKFKIQVGHGDQMVFFAVRDIEQAINKLKRGKSAGQDNVTA